MIAFWDSLPLIQLANGHSVAFERTWLIRSLTRAAARAGFAEWWLADHVAQSVTEYLRQELDLTVIPIDQLTTAVRSVLEVIGYAEVSQQYQSGRPCIRISLPALAREAGSGYELAFFELLGRQIHQVVHEQGCDFELLGLEQSVKVLKARKAWSRDCDALRCEIIHYARTQTEQVAAGQEVAFSLS